MGIYILICLIGFLVVWKTSFRRRETPILFLCGCLHFNVDFIIRKSAVNSIFLHAVISAVIDSILNFIDLFMLYFFNL